MPVELGFVEQRKAWKLRSKFFPSKVGGCPAWLRLNNLPSRSELLCKHCNKPLTFLLQVNAPLSSKEYAFHRIIFIFMCRNVECNKSTGSEHFVVLRSQLPRKNDFFSFDPPVMNEKLSSEPSAEKYQPICSICGCSASIKCEKCAMKDYCCEDHRDKDWEWNHVNDCQVEKKDSGKAGEKETKPKRKQVINHFLLQEFDLVMETEESVEEGPERSEQERMKDYEKYTKLSNFKEFQGMEIGDVEKHITRDKIFNRFNKRIKQEPEQVLRYERGGEPLWCSSENVPTEQDIPNCSCGAKRIFEFQVVPQLLHYLAMDYELDWGTLVVYTCSNSCKIGTESYAREVLWKQNISS